MKVENFKRFSLKMLRCEARAFPVGTAYGYMISRPFFTPRKTRMRMNLDHVANGRFVLGETFIVSRLMAIGCKYASNKGMSAV